MGVEDGVDGGGVVAGIEIDAAGSVVADGDVILQNAPARWQRRRDRDGKQKHARRIPASQCSEGKRVAICRGDIVRPRRAGGGVKRSVGRERGGNDNVFGADAAVVVVAKHIDERSARRGVAPPSSIEIPRLTPTPVSAVVFETELLAGLASAPLDESSAMPADVVSEEVPPTGWR